MKTTVVLCLFLVSSLRAGVYLTIDDALTLAFPGNQEVQSQSVFLTPAQKEAIEQEAQARLERDIISYYVGTDAEGNQSYAFFENHIVRSMPESLMVVIDPPGKIKFVEVLAFHEPEDYIAPEKWLDQFKGQALSDDLWVKRGLRNITGSTLTTEAITRAVRRALATYNVAIRNSQN